MNTKQHLHVRTMTQMAILIAIMLVLELTGIGMLKIGALEMTILQVPVIIGAIVLGPGTGAGLGLVFGLISFWECFGRSSFGVTLLGINPVLTFLVCVPTRTLMGWLCGLIYRGVHRRISTGIVPHTVASLAGALLNTLFFMSMLIICFGQTEFILSLRGDMDLLPFLIAFVGLQGFVEALLCAFLGSTISKAVCAALKQ